MELGWSTECERKLLLNRALLFKLSEPYFYISSFFWFHIVEGTHERCNDGELSPQAKCKRVIKKGYKAKLK